MDRPTRVQLSRRKGWRLPPNAVVVARPGHWGNPFRVERYGRTRAVALFRRMLESKNDGGAAMLDADEQRDFDDASRMWKERLGDVAGRIRDELHGRNLACWCPLDEPCHADVLLDIANSPAGDDAGDR